MKKILLIVFLSLLSCNLSFSKEVRAAYWSEDSITAYNSCWIILSFICSSEEGVIPDLTTVSINDFIMIYNKNSELIKKFKVKKIEYSNGRCWITPQPIRRFTTYFTTNKCIVNE